MSGAVVVRCPAKVNWSLRVLGRRADGYHELDTVFQAIDLHDVLEAEPSRGITLECDDPELPTDRRNLVVRAAEALFDRGAARGASGAALRLRKAIPTGAGLGGGSSDAAGTIVALDRLWGLELDRATARRIAVDLGSDVAFFLVGGTARGRGRGERLETLPFLGEVPLLLGVPPFPLSTADVYARHARRLTRPDDGVSVSRLSALKAPEEKDFGPARNDLEVVVFEGWPELGRFREALVREGATRALLSGSGSAVFGAFEDDRAVERAAAALHERFGAWRLLPARGVRDAVHLVAGGDLRSSR